MNRFSRMALLVLGLILTASVSTANAQYRSPLQFRPYSRPKLSPYLNFLRGGDPASNYYLGVRQQRRQRFTNQAFRGSILNLDRRQRALEGEAAELVNPLGTTGHQTGFMIYGNYYSQGVGPISGPARFTGTPAARRRR